MHELHSIAGLRVGVLYNADRGIGQGEALDDVAVTSVADSARGVAAVCEQRGASAVLVACPRDPRELLEAIHEARADVWVNFVESLDGDARFEAAVAWVLELAQVAYTGSPPTALTLCLDKTVSRAILATAGIPVARGTTLVRGDEPLPALRFPVIVKPARSDASHGIALESVVSSVAAVRERAAYLRQTYDQASVVEEYIEGREFNVSILGEGATAETLPLAEIDFAGFPAGAPKIVTYIAKWGDESQPEFSGSRTVAARDVSPELAARIREVALAAYRVLGARDYGRVDIRLHATDGPIVLEVNPNPDLSACAGMSIAADMKGMSYADLVERVILSALERRHHAIASAPGR